MQHGDKAAFHIADPRTVSAFVIFGKGAAGCCSFFKNCIHVPDKQQIEGRIVTIEPPVGHLQARHLTAIKRMVGGLPPDLIKAFLEKTSDLIQAGCIMTATVDIDDGFEIFNKLIIA